MWFVCCADTGESCFEVKIEADSDSLVEYQHDDMQSMGMYLFLSALMTIVLFSSEFFHCDQDNCLNQSKFQGQSQITGPDFLIL